MFHVTLFLLQATSFYATHDMRYMLGQDLVTKKLSDQYMWNRARSEVDKYCNVVKNQTNIVRIMDEMSSKCDMHASHDIMYMMLSDVVVALRTNVTMFANIVRFQHDGMSIVVSTKDRVSDLKNIMQQQLRMVCNTGQHAIDGKIMKQLVDANWNKTSSSLFLYINSRAELFLHASNISLCNHRRQNDHVHNNFVYILVYVMCIMYSHRMFTVFF